MKKRYLYLGITLFIWFILNIIFLLSGLYDSNSFYVSLIIAFVNIVIFGIGYVGYELDEKPYVIMHVLASCPLILSLVLIFIRTESYTLAFFLIPIIFGIVMIVTLGITAEIGGFDLEATDLIAYLIIIPIFYLINFTFILILGFLNITINNPFPWITPSFNPFNWITISILIYALNYIFIIPLP